MTLATDRLLVQDLQRLTLEDYLTYNDGADTRYELVSGEINPDEPWYWKAWQSD